MLLNKLRNFCVLLLLLIAVTTWRCKQNHPNANNPGPVSIASNQSQPEEGGSTSVGTGNPLSAFCLQIGGIDMNVQEIVGGNQFDFCQLSEAIINSATLEALSSGQPQQATTKFIDHPSVGANGSPNNSNQDLANSYCLGLGGKIVSAKNISHAQPLSLCLFADQSEMETNTLYRGPNYAGNRALVQWIKSK